jgi:hypothetical protein
MNELLMSLILGLLFFLVFFYLALRGEPSQANDWALNEVYRIVDLQGLPFANPDLLFRPTDYEMLRSRPQLLPLAKQLNRDRRDIVLSWLRLLEADVKTLWRFRRFLTRNGAPVTSAEEVRVAATAMLALVALGTLRVLVACLGPFRLASFLRQTRQLAEATLQLSADLLGRLPRAIWPEVDRRWNKEPE